MPSSTAIKGVVLKFLIAPPAVTANENAAALVLSGNSPISTAQGISSSYRFRPGDRVKIISVKHQGANGTVDALVLQGKFALGRAVIAKPGMS